MNMNMWQCGCACRLIAAASPLCIFSTHTNARADDVQDSPSKFEVPASDETRALGIEIWVVDYGEIRGLNASSQRVAELQIKPWSTTIESIYPDRGVRELKHHSVDTLSERAQTYLKAFGRDLQAVVSSQQHANASGNGASVYEFIDCYTAIQCAELGMNCVANNQCSSWFCSRTDPRCVDPFPFALNLDF